MRSLPAWLPYADLACAVAAGALWYLRPEIGPWPLLLVLSPWLVRLVAAGRPGWATPFDLPLVLFVATAGLAVWSAYDRTVAWSKFWQIVGGVFLFYALANGLAQAGRAVLADQGLAGEPAEDEAGERPAAAPAAGPSSMPGCWLFSGPVWPSILWPPTTGMSFRANSRPWSNWAGNCKRRCRHCPATGCIPMWPAG
jgi:hypothetical protein